MLESSKDDPESTEPCIVKHRIHSHGATGVSVAHTQQIRKTTVPTKFSSSTPQIAPQMLLRVKGLIASLFLTNKLCPNYDLKYKQINGKWCLGKFFDNGLILEALIGLLI